jgi:hypothetical protein
MAENEYDLFAALEVVGEEHDQIDRPSKATRLLRAAQSAAIFPEQRIMLTVTPDAWNIRIAGSGDGYVSLNVNKDGTIVVEREIDRDGKRDYQRCSI